jgi:Plasmid pRiA4b ORF-3-like protein
VEKHLPTVLNVQYRVRITGKRACPPEDCGGPWGYAELLEVLNETGHLHPST